jgi:lysophospholipase L1-like esterase
MISSNANNRFAGITPVNSGHSGDDVKKALARLDRDVLRFHPDVVIVTLGTNDSTTGTLEEFKENYRKLLTILKENVPAIITRTSNPAIDMKNGKEDPSWNASKPEFMAAVVEISAELGITCIDHYSMWKASTESRYSGELIMLMGNGLHPNEFGHRRFYSEIAPFLGLEPDFQCEYTHLLRMQSK